VGTHSVQTNTELWFAKMKWRRFDGFRIYSKDESPPAIPLADVIESLIELNTFH